MKPFPVKPLFLLCLFILLVSLACANSVPTAAPIEPTLAPATQTPVSTLAATETPAPTDAPPTATATDIPTSPAPLALDFRGLVWDIILSVDPQTPDTLYTYFKGTVYQSLDGGHTWKVMPDDEIPTIPPIILNRFLQKEEFPYIRRILDPQQETGMLALDPVTPTHWYGVSANGSYLLESTDAGQSWAQISVLLSPAYEGMGFLAIDPLNPASLFLTTWGGIYKSSDGGLNWQTVLAEPGPSGYAFHTMLFDPSSPGTLYAIDDMSLFKSTNGGNNWQWIYGENIPFITEWLVIDPLDSKRLYGMDSYRALQTSADGGQTWAATDLGLPPVFVHAFAIDPINPSNRYAILDSGETSGLFKSTDGGQTWAEIPTQLHEFQFKQKR